MTATLNITPGRTRTMSSFALMGATASTNYLFNITTPSGTLLTMEAQTNGGGAATVTAVMGEPGEGFCQVTTVPIAAVEVASTPFNVVAQF